MLGVLRALGLDQWQQLGLLGRRLRFGERDPYRTALERLWSYDLAAVLRDVLAVTGRGAM